MVPSLRATRCPVIGGASAAYWPFFQAGSLVMASRWMERSAMANGAAAAVPEMQHSRRAAPGNMRREREHHHAAERGAHDGVEALDAAASAATS